MALTINSTETGVRKLVLLLSRSGSDTFFFFFFLPVKGHIANMLSSLQMVTAAMKLKDAYSLEGKL